MLRTLNKIRSLKKRYKLANLILITKKEMRNSELTVKL